MFLFFVAFLLLSHRHANTEYVPSADHPFMMEGQGTIGLEMLQQVCYNYPFLYFLRTSKFLLG